MYVGKSLVQYLVLTITDYCVYKDIDWVQMGCNIDSSGLSYAGVQEKLGVMNKGTVYALWDYKTQNPDELAFSEGDAITILRRQDDSETEWWWAQLEDNEGYVPRNLLGVTT